MACAAIVLSTVFGKPVDIDEPFGHTELAAVLLVAETDIGEDLCGLLLRGGPCDHGGRARPTSRQSERDQATAIHPV